MFHDCLSPSNFMKSLTITWPWLRMISQILKQLYVRCIADSIPTKIHTPVGFVETGKIILIRGKLLLAYSNELLSLFIFYYHNNSNYNSHQYTYHQLHVYYDARLCLEEIQVK